MSSAFSTKGAPFLISRFTPFARSSVGVAGTANTSLPCSNALFAVISDPERRAASMTTSPIDRPEMMRLRWGKFDGCGFVCRGSSETMTPFWRISSYSRRFCGG